MTKHIAYLMRVGTEGLPHGYPTTPQNNQRKKAHMPIYKVGVGIVRIETERGYQLDGTVERETRRIAKGATVLEIFQQVQSRIIRPTFKSVPITTRVEDITEEQYQAIARQSL